MSVTAETEITKSEEWRKATSYTISDEDVARGSTLTGYDQASRDAEYVQTVSLDAIRNFAHGCGNDNPLFCDPAYAGGTRWGSVIAPGMMAGIINAPMRGDPAPDWVKAARKSLFRGIHVFVSGSTWDWYRPIYPGDTLYSFRGQESLELKKSEFSGRSVIQVLRDVKVNQRAEVVAVYKILQVLTERKSAVDKGKYSAIQPAHYTDEDIAAIDAVYAQEEVRGAVARDFADIQVGDALGKMAKGPLTVTDVVCFHAGGYGFVPYKPCVGRLAWQNRQRIPAFYIKNEQGIPDVAQRLHWDPKWAQAVGNPMAYDYGVMRENYLYHYLTDWCGDDGVVLHVHDEIRKFNYIGDTQFITGEVTGKREENGRNLVDVAVRFTNQRGEETMKATAVIALPSAGRPVLYPDVPADLAERAARMMARHWELGRRS
ncbi:MULTISPECIES: MaoC family dehydratase N-terminal domain-containing protein [unclassified Azospirillum]|uniref:FAS1-like dehydratase domain-containing protein n=1 Tax=unclassified Azospirillum TaxID=2630922 RepID=UPI000B71465C|nr:MULTISPECIES: MaoC family dehydratase N-terminal domain-containing protein [unclassified Azospirillum]SNT08666.1 Acyl dehydratase [Azospirillum sp. RU38E]SNT23074.1 Acyl dehydratase [Azospirillum sp. RU37A]